MCVSLNLKAKARTNKQNFLALTFSGARFLFLFFYRFNVNQVQNGGREMQSKRTARHANVDAINLKPNAINAFDIFV